MGTGPPKHGAVPAAPVPGHPQEEPVLAQAPLVLLISADNIYHRGLVRGGDKTYLERTNQANKGAGKAERPGKREVALVRLHSLGSVGQALRCFPEQTDRASHSQMQLTASLPSKQNKPISLCCV